MDNLYVICEGGVHTVEYLHKNGVYPNALLMEPGKFQELLPYITQNDDILVLIKGMTDFNMVSIYSLLGKLDEFKGRYKKATILSNIPLGHIRYEYYLYSGDLFYGTVQKVVENEYFDLDVDGNVVEKKKMLFKDKKKKILGNPIALYYKKYNNNKTKLMIYRKDKMNLDASNIQREVFEYEKEIKIVDLYKNKEQRFNTIADLFDESKFEEKGNGSK